MHYIKILVAAAVLLLHIAAAAQPLAPGKGSFPFSDAQSTQGKPLTVWYYKPANLEPAAKIMFVMHGVDRNGETYRDRWIRHAEQYHFLLLVPEFSAQYFPTAAYQYGNMTDPRKERWSFQAIEQLFDQVRQQESLATDKYYIYGHSAGAQFVHRMMLMLPSPRVELAFSANAGTYTMPVYPSWKQAAFPMALDRKLVDEEQLAAVFSRKLIVMLGEDDVKEQGAHVPNSPQAREQGKNRFERGQNFFSAARQQAAAMHAAFNWELLTVPEVGHSDSGMSKAAVRYLSRK